MPVTSYTPADLLTAERHIAEGERHIVEQEEVLTRLRLKGADTSLAEELLAEFRDTLKMHRALAAGDGQVSLMN